MQTAAWNLTAVAIDVKSIAEVIAGDTVSLLVAAYSGASQNEVEALIYKLRSAQDLLRPTNDGPEG